MSKNCDENNDGREEEPQDADSKRPGPGNRPKLENGSRTSGLFASFPSGLTDNELSHIRKWNHRLNRTEVFKKYYYPAKWELDEMQEIMDFLKLADPLAPSNGGNGAAGGQGRKQRNNRQQQTSSHRRANNSNAASQLSQSLRSPSSNGSASGADIIRLSLDDTDESVATETGSRTPGTAKNNFAFASLTSSLGSSGTRGHQSLLNPNSLLAEPAPDASKTTEDAINAIFFPFVHDPKSVLLKRGPVLLDGISERELLFFTYGFVVAEFDLEHVLRLILELGDEVLSSERRLVKFLSQRFNEMDADGSGDIDKFELRQLVLEMGIPMSEDVLDELFKKCDVDGSGMIRWEGFQSALLALFQPLMANKEKGHPPKSKEGFSIGGSGGVVELGKKLLGAFGSKKKNKIESAFLFSSVVRVESLNIVHSDRTADVANSSYGSSSFAVYVAECEEPLIFVCAKPKHRELWVDAFRCCVVRAYDSDERTEAAGLRTRLGWQHLAIQSTIHSLVILDDVSGLKRALENAKSENCPVKMKKLVRELSILDEYNGYSALHYATILGHLECLALLLQSGATVTLGDHEGLSPMFHALSLRNEEAADILEKYGADRNEELKAVIRKEIMAEEASKTNDELEAARQPNKSTQ